MSRVHNPAREKKLEQEMRPNPYDDMPREARGAVFYRAHTYTTRGPGRRELRDYANAIARLLPMPPGSTPITQAAMDKLFRGKPGRVKVEERAAARQERSKLKKRAKRFAREAAKREGN